MITPDLQPVRHFWLPLAIIAILVLLTTWLGQLADAPKATSERVIGHEPDYFVEDFRAVAFDPAGAPRYRLSALRMTHFMDDDSTALEAPHFTREERGRARVVVRSLRGQVSPDGDNVYFEGDVRMMQERPAGQPPLEVETEFLHVQPDRELIQTDRAVRLKEGVSQMSGAGMTADGKSRTLAISGRVKGVYEKHR